MSSRQFPRATFPAILTIALAIGALSLAVNHRFAAEANGPGTSFSIDAIPDAAGYTAAPVVQNAASVAVAGTFAIDVAVDSGPPAPWGSYQVQIDYTDSILDATGIPTGWGTLPTASTGGNLFAFTGGNLCDPSPAANAVINEDDSDGNGANYTMTCAHQSLAQGDSGGGTIVRLFFTCENAGQATIAASDVNATFFLGTDLSTTYNDHQHSATITCTGGSTNTPTSTATSTNTPSTPVNTNTPTNTATSTNTPSTPVDTSTPTSTNTPTATSTSTPVTPVSTNTPGTPSSGGGGRSESTNTPATTATGTAGPSQTPSSPAPANTPRPGATAPGGGAGAGGVRPPDTGAGPSDGISLSLWLLIAMGAIMAIGGSATVVYSRRRSS